MVFETDKKKLIVDKEPNVQGLVVNVFYDEDKIVYTLTIGRYTVIERTYLPPHDIPGLKFECANNVLVYEARTDTLWIYSAGGLI